MLHFHVRQAEAKAGAGAGAEVYRQRAHGGPKASADGKTERDIGERGAENFAGEFRRLTCCGSERKQTAASQWLWLTIELMVPSCTAMTEPQLEMKMEMEMAIE